MSQGCNDSLYFTLSHIGIIEVKFFVAFSLFELHADVKVHKFIQVIQKFLPDFPVFNHRDTVQFQFLYKGRIDVLDNDFPFIDWFPIFKLSVLFFILVGLSFYLAFVNVYVVIFVLDKIL